MASGQLAKMVILFVHAGLLLGTLCFHVCVGTPLALDFWLGFFPGFLLHGISCEMYTVKHACQLFRHIVGYLTERSKVAILI